MNGAPAGAARRSARWPIAAIAAFLVTRAILLAHVHAATDIRFYHAYFVRAASGEVPYRDIAIAYPPIAWWVMAWPGATNWPTYRDRFRRTMLVFDAGAFALFTAALLRRRPAYAAWGSLTYVAATAVLEDLLYDRLDAGLLFLLMLWAYAWLRSLDDDGAWSGWWRMAAYLALGAGVAYKLVPGVMLPFLLLSERSASACSEVSRRGAGRDRRVETGLMRRRWRSVLAHTFAFAIGAGFSFLVHYPSAGLATLDFLKYHLGRGVQIESMFAVPLWLLSKLGVPVAVNDLPDTIELVGPGVPAMVWLSNLLTAGFVGALAARVVWLGRRYDRGQAFVYSGLALAGLILFAKGLSPQYFIWVIPMLLLCGAETFPTRRFALLCVLLVALAALTTAIFPFGLRALLALEPAIVGVLAARNLLFAGLVFWIGARLAAQPRLDPAA